MSAEDDDKVGYCKPPKHSRFKPGQSGNPRGRPRKNRSIEAMIKHELDQTVALKEGGREIRLTKREALIKQLVNRAISGDLKPMQLVLAHLEKHKDIEPFTATEADDAELLRAMCSSQESLDQGTAPSIDIFFSDLFERPPISRLVLALFVPEQGRVATAPFIVFQFES